MQIKFNVGKDFKHRGQVYVAQRDMIKAYAQLSVSKDFNFYEHTVPYFHSLEAPHLKHPFSIGHHLAKSILLGIIRLFP
jgi:hypothetical protein